MAKAALARRNGVQRNDKAGIDLAGGNAAFAPAVMPKVRIKYTPLPEEVEIEFDRSKIAWGDLLLMFKVKDDPNRQDELLIMINKLLSAAVGRNVDELPAYVVKELVQELNNLSNLGGNSAKN